MVTCRTRKEVQEGGSDFKHSEMDTKGHGRVAFHLWEVPKAQQRAKQIYELPLKRPNGWIQAALKGDYRWASFYIRVIFYLFIYLFIWLFLLSYEYEESPIIEMDHEESTIYDIRL